MSSTNSTTNYELSQFLGTDKPSWLGDYNSDMSKIDTAVHTVSATATGADGKADANATNIGNLANLTTTAKTNVVAAINEVKSTADTAQNTATTAATNANTALTDIAKFNLTSISELTVTASQGAVVSADTHVYCAKDSSNSIFKLYGTIHVNNLLNNNGNLQITLSDTGLNPASAYTINGAALSMQAYSNGNEFTRGKNITINANGTVTVGSALPLDNITTDVNYLLFPCVYFNKNFGDQ